MAWSTGLETTSESDGGAVVWRQLTPRLWVGRRAGDHLGQIELGRRYEVSNGEGAIVGRCRHLAEAQALLAHVRDRTRHAA